ncbi:MAG: hypothetical protein AB4063_18545 [Crocosphaera sp.]
MTVTFHHTFDHTLLAYLLSLRDYAQSLTSKDKQNLDKFAKEFRLYPDDIENHIEPFLVAKIAENPQLKQLFTTYQNKLDSSGDIPFKLLPKLDNLIQLINRLNSKLSILPRCKIPYPLPVPTPIDQHIILENMAIVISESPEPEETSDGLQWMEPLKQWLG